MLPVINILVGTCVLGDATICLSWFHVRRWKSYPVSLKFGVVIHDETYYSGASGDDFKPQQMRNFIIGHSPDYKNK
jgi:hypothetical protein